MKPCNESCSIPCWRQKYIIAKCVLHKKAVSEDFEILCNTCVTESLISISYLLHWYVLISDIVWQRLFLTWNSDTFNFGFVSWILESFPPPFYSSPFWKENCFSEFNAYRTNHYISWQNHAFRKLMQLDRVFLDMYVPLLFLLISCDLIVSVYFKYVPKMSFYE